LKFEIVYQRYPLYPIRYTQYAIRNTQYEIWLYFLTPRCAIEVD